MTIFTGTAQPRLASAAMPRAPSTSAFGARRGGAHVALGHDDDVRDLDDAGFHECRLSPEPGCTQNTTVSAAIEMSVSDWPTPTVSTSTTS